jgi:hypothetical protein
VPPAQTRHWQVGWNTWQFVTNCLTGLEIRAEGSHRKLSFIGYVPKIRLKGRTDILIV